MEVKSQFVTCASGGDDDHYHGSHVAGTIAALDNGFGVVGVAPGARIWAVNLLNQRGSGYTSWIVAGIDWVTANAATIEVANMSLGGSGFSREPILMSRVALRPRGQSARQDLTQTSAKQCETVKSAEARNACSEPTCSQTRRSANCPAVSSHGRGHWFDPGS